MRGVKCASRGKAGRFNRGRRSHVNASTSESVFFFHSLCKAIAGLASPPRRQPGHHTENPLPTYRYQRGQGRCRMPARKCRNRRRRWLSVWGTESPDFEIRGVRSPNIKNHKIIISRENMSNRNADLSRLLLPSFRPFPDLASPARRCKG